MKGYILDRIERITKELGVPMTKLCRNMDITPHSIYAWKKGEINLKPETVKRIDDYLSKYGF